MISPLIALMRDQVRALQELGIKAGAITSGNTQEEIDAGLGGFRAGKIEITLYCA